MEFKTLTFYRPDPAIKTSGVLAQAARLVASECGDKVVKAGEPTSSSAPARECWTLAGWATVLPSTATPPHSCQWLAGRVVLPGLHCQSCQHYTASVYSSVASVSSTTLASLPVRQRQPQLRSHRGRAKCSKSFQMNSPRRLNCRSHLLLFCTVLRNLTPRPRLSML